MKKKLLAALMVLAGLPALFAQQAPSRQEAELQRIGEISRYTSIESFQRAKETNKAARKGDLVVLQDENLKLYYGIIDTVRSAASIGIILYNEQNQRELVEAGYEDLYYLRTSQPVMKKTPPVLSDREADYVEEMAKRDAQLKIQEYKILQMADYVERAGRSYETGDILLFVSFGSAIVGSALAAAGGLFNSTSVAATGSLLALGSAGCVIGSVIYRFRGHQKLKDAGRVFRK